MASATCQDHGGKLVDQEAFSGSTRASRARAHDIENIVIDRGRARRYARTGRSNRKKMAAGATVAPEISTKNRTGLLRSQALEIDCWPISAVSRIENQGRTTACRGGMGEASLPAAHCACVGCSGFKLLGNGAASCQERQGDSTQDSPAIIAVDTLESMPEQNPAAARCRCVLDCSVRQLAPRSQAARVVEKTRSLVSRGSASCSCPRMWAERAGTARGCCAGSIPGRTALRINQASAHRFGIICCWSLRPAI